MNNPLIYVSTILGVVTIICLVAFLTIKDKKEAFGFDRNMKDGEITKNGRKIVIDHEQYIRLKSIISTVIEPD